MKLSKAFIEDIRELIRSARATVARGVDVVQVHTNFEIGRRIVQQEQKGKGRAAYGKEILKSLAERLTAEFGKGFSQTNLKLMRQFYIQNQDRIGQSLTDQWPTVPLLPGKSGTTARSQSLTDQLAVTLKPELRQYTLSWTHYVFLMGIKNPEERRFYEIEAAAQNWTVRELRRQFDSSLYERLALSRDKEGVRRLAREGQIVSQPQDLLKEPLVLEFLGLSEQTSYTESDLEAAIIDQLERFLLELGKGFLFEARQKRFTFDGEHFFVDLVFAQRCQHPRAPVPVVPAQQRGTPTQAAPVGAGSGR